MTGFDHASHIRSVLSPVLQMRASLKCGSGAAPHWKPWSSESNLRCDVSRRWWSGSCL